MKFMLLIYGNESGWSALTQSEIDEIGNTHRRIQRDLLKTGELLDHKELALDGSRIVRTNKEAPTVTNGPLVNGKEILGGYYLVNCADMDRAADIAGQFLEAKFAPIEIRRLSGDTTWDDGAPQL